MTAWDADRFARLRLARTNGIGPLTFRQLISQYGSATEAVTRYPERVKRAGRSGHLLAPDRRIEQEIDRTECYGATILFETDEAYPALFRALSHPPPVITCFGRIDLLASECVAMVGSRNASAAAIRQAHDLARDLGQSGWTVVSGLARGVDTACHKGSLATGTIAVIAGGIDNVYPAENKSLYEAIARDGLIISEAPFGLEPKARDFPRRNRLITGLSHGVVVVEAAKRSGSLISARTALEQGREVMAIPGSPLDPRTQGSNGLIRSGATLVENAEHVIEAIAPMILPRQSNLFAEASLETDDAEDAPVHAEDQQRLLKLLSPTPTSLSDLAVASQLPVRICAIHLVELELAGHAISLPGGLVQRAV